MILLRGLLLLLVTSVAHSAIVTRYFSTAGAGAANGTSWADRAALFSAGNWSSVITGFNFAGSDSLEVFIGPGTYTCGQGMSTSLFANAPTAANPLLLSGCDSSGVRLSPPNPNWTAAEPIDWDSALPVIAATGNLSTIASGVALVRCLKFTSSGRSGAVITVAVCDWCIIENSMSNSSAAGMSGTPSNSGVIMSGTAFDYAITVASNIVVNCLVRASGSPSSGNRRGVTLTGFSNAHITRSLFTGFVGGAIISTSTQTNQYGRITQCVLANNGGPGVALANTASQSLTYLVSQCMITGNTYGINADASRVLALNNRLRDNSAGNFAGLGNYPETLGNYTTDSDDASEYVDATGGDFRIKSTATIAGMGFGIADQPSAASAEITTAYVR